jgi:hypothetical protein
VWSAAFCSAAAVARAQTPAQTARNNAIKAKAGGIVLDLRNERRASPGDTVQVSVETVLSQEKQSGLYLLLLAPVANDADRAVNLFRVEADEARVDKQVGAASSSSGSTSLTSKGSAPAVLGFAVENGALEKSVSGTAITFTGRPVQIIQALQKTPFAESFTQIEENASLGALNRFSFGFTFDTSRDNAAAFTASANQLSSYSARFDVLNHRDPRDSIHNARWETLRQSVQQQANLRLLEAFNLVSESEVFKARFNEWLAPTSKALTDALNSNATDDVLGRIVAERLSNFPSAAGIPGADAALRGFAEATDAMLEARQNILDYVETSPIVAIHFTGDRAAVARPGEIQLPDTSTVDVIAELAPFHGGSFTLNGSATIFNTVPVNITASRLRHVEVSSQLDIPVAASASQIGNVVLSFAFKYKHLPNDVLGIAAGGQAATTGSSNADAALKGDIVYGQAKLTFPVKGSGVKIPVSVTFANRSELIKESVVRANLGLTLDMDTIIGKLKP